jgi:hypothetical protein
LPGFHIGNQFLVHYLGNLIHGLFLDASPPLNLYVRWLIDDTIPLGQIFGGSYLLTMAIVMKIITVVPAGPLFDEGLCW